MKGTTALQQCIFIFGIVLFLIGSIFYRSPVHADDQNQVVTVFSSDIIVDNDNIASVTISVRFRNNTDVPTILTTYDLYIGDCLPVGVTAVHDESILRTEVLEARGSVIRVTFGDVLLRDGDTYTFDVVYRLEHYLHQAGGAYDVQIPLFRRSNTTGTETISLSYPQSYGRINYASAEYTETIDEDRVSVAFANVDGFDTLFASIGSQRRYSFVMERKLTNETEMYAQFEVMLPPDTQGQELILTSVSEYPSQSYLDDAGNYVLVYDVPPLQTIWARFQGIFIQNVPAIGTHVLTIPQKEYYLDTDTDWWRILDAGTTNRVVLGTEGLSEKDMIDWIYEFTINELILSEGFRGLHGVEYRKGADIAIKTYKNASVEDYADVFVALCRLVGIPSRIVAGYVFPYSLEGSALGMFHVWPQYWSSEYGWVSVDPAYQAYTEFHQKDQVGLQRVIVSLSYDSAMFSLYPETTKDIMVTEQTVAPINSVISSIEIPNEIQSGGVTTGTLVLRNEGNSILSALSVSLSNTNELRAVLNESVSKLMVLPGEEVRISFTVDQPDWYESGERMLSFTIVGETAVGTHRVVAEKTLQVAPLWWVIPLSWFITVVAFVLLAGGIWSGAKLSRTVVSWFNHTS